MKRLARLAPYKNQIIFTVLFILIAILFMTIGFWKTLLIIAFASIGFAIGTVKDENRSISSILAYFQALFDR